MERPDPGDAIRIFIISFVVSLLGYHILLAVLQAAL